MSLLDFVCLIEDTRGVEGVERGQRDERCFRVGGDFIILVFSFVIYPSITRRAKLKYSTGMVMCKKKMLVKIVCRSL